MMAAEEVIRGLRSVYRSVIGYLRDGPAYLAHKLRGTSYGAYYADRMNRIIRRNPNWGLNLNKRFQLDYLIAHGLRPDAHMLDYGCGALAAGIHFIDYLAPGKYVGVDISSEVLAEGQRRLVSKGLQNKHAELHRIEPGSVAALAGKRFDLIWAQSVFTHMPPDDIDRLLRDVRPFMHTKTRFYATFARTDGAIHQKRFKDWYYNVDFFRAAAAKFGFDIALMPDWSHPDDCAATDTLIELTLADKQPSDHERRS